MAASGRAYCRRVLVSMLIAMALSMPLLVHSSRALNGTPPLVEVKSIPSSVQSESETGAAVFGEGAVDESEREVPTGPDPLHHHYDPKCRALRY